MARTRTRTKARPPKAKGIAKTKSAAKTKSIAKAEATATAKPLAAVKSKKASSRAKRNARADGAPKAKRASAVRTGVAVSTVPLALGPLLGVRVGGAIPTWFRPLDEGVKLTAGAAAPQSLRVPADAANRALVTAVRLVADLPTGSSGDVVWTRGTAELLVHTAGVNLACAPGIVTISIPVSCDQVLPGATMAVPFAVGTDDRTAGLVMSSFSRPAGPDVVTTLWSEALTAFAWETLLQLAQQLCGAVGRDGAGRALVPASIAAAAGVLIVQPMARNERSARTAQAHP